MLSLKEIQSLEADAAETIDTSWHDSWHWKRGEFGLLTDEGWQQVYSDCQSRIDNCEEDLRRLLKLRDRLDEFFAEKAST